VLKYAVPETLPTVSGWLVDSVPGHISFDKSSMLKYVEYSTPRVLACSQWPQGGHCAGKALYKLS
jgi:hypothetical protein